MSSRTVPFSARISMEDAEFISTLTFEGAHTPSDKLRALLSEARRRHQKSPRYSDNLEEMQDWLGPLKRQLMVREHDLSHHSDVTRHLLDWLPDVLALVATLAANIEHADVAQMEKTELDLLQRILRLNEALLPLAIVTPFAVSGEVSVKRQEALRLLAHMIHEKMVTQGDME